MSRPGRDAAGPGQLDQAQAGPARRGERRGGRGARHRSAPGAVPPWLAIPVTVLLALGVTQLLAVGMTSPLRQMTEAARRMARGDYAVRVRRRSRRGRRAGPRVQPDGGRPGRRSTGSGATWSPTSPTSCAPRCRRWWRCWRTSSTASTEPDPETSGPRSPRPSGSAPSWPTCSTCPGSTPAWSPLDRSTRCRLRGLLDERRRRGGSPARARSTYDVRVEPADLTVHADPARLHQLLANLLDNAPRHSPAGGVVRLSAGTGRRRTVRRLEVADEGAGIAAGRPRAGLRTVRHPPATPPAAAPASAWPSPAGSPTCTAAGSPRRPGGGGDRRQVPRRAPARSRRTRRARTVPVPPVPERTPHDPAPRPRAPRPSRRPAAPVPTIAATAPSARVDRPRARQAARASCSPAWRSGCFAGRDPARRTSRARRRPWCCSPPAAGARAQPAPPEPVHLGLRRALRRLRGDGGRPRRRVDHRARALLAAGARAGGPDPGPDAARASCWRPSPGRWPGIRGMPWLGRTLRAFGGGRQTAAAGRARCCSSLLGVLVFGLLFASGDAIVRRVARRRHPRPRRHRACRGCSRRSPSAGVVLAASYLALNPPASSRDGRPAAPGAAPVRVAGAGAARRRGVRAVPGGAGGGVSSAATTTSQRTPGLTYAEYVHQGFGQLTFATLLTLLVVWAAARKAAPDRPRPARGCGSRSARCAC